VLISAPDTYLEKNYEDDDDDDNDKSESIKSEASVASKLPLPTQRLVELIFNENHFNAALEDIGRSHMSFSRRIV
jgi:poly [ADP-ribose] polymerase 2/3/4